MCIYSGDEDHDSEITSGPIIPEDAVFIEDDVEDDEDDEDEEGDEDEDDEDEEGDEDEEDEG